MNSKEKVCATATLTTRNANTSSPGRIPRCPGSTTWAARTYFGLISNTAGGYSFYRDARLRRLTRYRYNNVPLDVGGRYIYLRDDDCGLAVFWSPTWQPTRRDLDDYTCRHGMGYTVIGSAYQGHRGRRSATLCPLGENLEIWQLTRDQPPRRRPAKLSVFSLRRVLPVGCPGRRHQLPAQLQHRRGGGRRTGVIYHKTEYRERRNHFAYFACSEALAGFDTQREAFLGPYRGWDDPAAVERGRSCELDGPWLGADRLAPRPARRWSPAKAAQIIFVLGYHENPDEREVRSARLADDQQADGQAGHRQVPGPGKRGGRL